MLSLIEQVKFPMAAWHFLNGNCAGIFKNCILPSNGMIQSREAVFYEKVMQCRSRICIFCKKAGWVPVLTATENACQSRQKQEKSASGCQEIKFNGLP
jgi:hypothetical protein